jgi:zinc protease
MRRLGPYKLGFQTRNEQTGQALRVLRDTLQDFIANGPTQEELEEAKNNIIGGFPIRIASNANIVEYLAVIGFYDLPLDYLERFTDRISAVTATQIQDAYRRRIAPQRMVTVTLGGEPQLAGGS